MATPFVGSDSKTNADAVVTLPAVGGVYNYVTLVVASYTAAIAGKLTIKNGTTTIFDTDVVVANPPPFVFNALGADIGNALEVRLLNGGITIGSKLNVIGYTTDTYQ